MKRNIAVCIILSLVTCGIYGIYWFVTLTNEVADLSDIHTATGGVAFLLTLVTCGIYGIYWAYKQGEKIEAVKAKKGLPASSAPVLYLVLCLLGLGIVAYALMKNEINQLAD